MVRVILHLTVLRKTMTKRFFMGLMPLILSLNVSAQVSHGGEPMWQTNPTLNYVPVHRMPGIDLDVLRAADEVTDAVKSAPWRFGEEFDVDIGLRHGYWDVMEGIAVWRTVIESPGALAVGLRFSEFQLPKGAKLFIWNREAIEFIGSFDHRNHKSWGGLATGLVAGDAAVVEIQCTVHQMDEVNLTIDQVVHAYRDVIGKASLIAESLGVERGPYGNSGACNINVNCPQGATWQCEKRSVALILSGGYAVCTGALVNNTAQDGTPLFLTANHCLGGNVGNWTFVFNHETAGCTGNNGPTNQTVSGAEILENSGASDFALLLLDETPPLSYDVFYAGWDGTDATNVQNTTGIHHPAGDLKKICIDEDAAYHANAAGAAVWWIDEWEDGVTEGGSSGSPLFDQNHRIIGQLYGGAALCQGTVNNGQFDYYGRMGVSFNNGIAEYIDPLGLGLEVLDGYPGQGCINSFAVDLGIGISGAPEGVICGGGEVVIEVNLTNQGTDELTSVVLGYAIDGGEEQTSSWTGSLEQYESTTVSLPAFEVSDGNTTVDVYVIAVNGGDDENSFNNSVETSFTAFAGDTHDFTLELVLDDYGSETTWDLRRLGQVIYEGGPYEDDQDGQVVTVPLCLEDGCYILRVYDSWGDGMCCDYGEGGWTILGPQEEVIVDGGEFGEVDFELFCTDEMNVSEAPQNVLSVYPSPARDMIHVNGVGSGASVRAYDITGRGIASHVIIAGDTRITTTSWPRGWAILRVEWNGQIQTARVLLE